MVTMSSESDSEVFFDAEEVTPVHAAKGKGKAANPESQDVSTSEAASIFSQEQEAPSFPGDSVAHFPVIQINEEDLKATEKKVIENERRRRKVEELRNRMLKDDDDVTELPSEQSSLTSSAEGIYPSRSSNHVAKLISTTSDESQSVVSLGKIGSILGGKNAELDTASMNSLDSANMCLNIGSTLSTGSRNACMKGAEPDLVASTKNAGTMGRPVAPPRRKRKNKTVSASVTPTDNCESYDFASLPSLSTSSDPIENLTRELECSLDIQSATRGQYVVKPQDYEQDRAEGPPSMQSTAETETSTTTITTTTAAVGSLPKSGSKANSLKKEEESNNPYMVRTRTDSGRPLTDQEILAQVKVVNLDTGEQIPLSLAEEHLPKCLNPLSLHIMRLTSEYVSTTALDKERESDEESIASRKTDALDAGRVVWSRTKGIGKLIRGRIENNFHALRTVVADKVHHNRHANEDVSDEEAQGDSRSNIEIKISSRLKSVDKGKSEFEKIRVVQELSGEHNGAVWTMKFSSCGRLLATAGQDHVVRIWVLRDSFKYFDDMKQKFNAEGKASPTPSQESAVSGSDNTKDETEDSVAKGPFMDEPFCRYKGHTAELLDVSWSKNYFILSSSMDKTVRLWHISRQECLCCFQHIDFVTAIAFHPRDDRYFLSGSLDGKLRLWNIPDKKVTLWHELEGPTKLITAVNFTQNGKIAMVGSYDGRCIFYQSYAEQLKYHTQILVRRSRGKKKDGRKISGIEAMPGEDKILVTSNDSRIRLYDLRDLSLSCKYKGYVNLSSQIKASFSHDGRYIISGSENQFIYIWKTFHDYATFSRRDRNDYWERIKAHNAVVTAAVFSPNPALILEQLERDQEDNNQSSADLGAPSCYVIVSADFSGTIKVFLHKSKTGATDMP